MEISELGSEELDSLYKLYKAQCDRDKSEPSVKDFSIWLNEKGYVSDD